MQSTREATHPAHDALFSVLRDRGYEYVCSIGERRPECREGIQTHRLAIIEKNGLEYIVKFSAEEHPGSRDGSCRALMEEPRISAQLAGIPGFAEIVDSGCVDSPRHVLSYVVKPYLPGPSLATVESITPRMRSQLASTVKEIHHRGYLLEPDLKLGEIVLDAEGRPTLTDCEKMTFIDPSRNPLAQRMDDFERIARLIYEKTNSPEDRNAHWMASAKVIGAGSWKFLTGAAVFGSGFMWHLHAMTETYIAKGSSPYLSGEVPWQIAAQTYAAGALMLSAAGYAMYGIIKAVANDAILSHQEQFRRF